MRLLTILFIAFCFWSCGSESGTTGNNNSNTTNTNTNTTNTNNTASSTPKPPQAIISKYVADLKEMTSSSRAIELQIEAAQNNPNTEEAEYELFEKQLSIDSSNMERLAKMLDDHGWIAQSVYGKEGSDQALAILNKGAGKFHNFYLPMLSKSFDQGEVNPAGYAEIYDKAMIVKGKKQLYGTQLSFSESEGRNTIHPIEDEANVDARRKKAGLEPMTPYWQKFGIVYPRTTSTTEH